MFRLDGLCLICIIPVNLQYMASNASKPLYIDRITYISNVSITKGNLYCATCPAQLSNVPSPIVQRSQPYCATCQAPLGNVRNSTIQRAQLYCATCPTLLCNVPNSTVQRAQPYCQLCPYLLSNVPSPTMQISPAPPCNMRNSIMQHV